MRVISLKFVKKVLDKEGDFIFNSTFEFIIFGIMLVLVITVLGVSNRVAPLHALADQALRYIEIEGRVDANTDAAIQQMIAATGLDCEYTIEAVYIPGTTNIQFGDMLAVRVSHTSYFGVGGIVRVPITLSSRSEGRSEVYWK